MSLNWPIFGSIDNARINLKKVSKWKDVGDGWVKELWEKSP